MQKRHLACMAKMTVITIKPRPPHAIQLADYVLCWGNARSDIAHVMIPSQKRSRLGNNFVPCGAVPMIGARF